MKITKIFITASTKVLLFIKKNLSKNKIVPVPINIHSIFIISDNGPNISILSGTIELAIIPNTPNTLPKYASSTFSCNNTVEGVLKNGIANPNTPMINIYKPKNGITPSKKVQAPITKLDKAMVCTQFLNPPQEAIITPPTIMPIEKVTSIAVSRQTSSPKLLVTCNGVKNATGPTNIKNTANIRVDIAINESVKYL